MVRNCNCGCNIEDFEVFATTLEPQFSISHVSMCNIKVSSIKTKNRSRSKLFTEKNKKLKLESINAKIKRGLNFNKNVLINWTNINTMSKSQFFWHVSKNSIIQKFSKPNFELKFQCMKLQCWNSIEKYSIIQINENVKSNTKFNTWMKCKTLELDFAIPLHESGRLRYLKGKLQSWRNLKEKKKKNYKVEVQWNEILLWRKLEVGKIEQIVFNNGRVWAPLLLWFHHFMLVK